jgi:hypothetical protein
MELVLKNVNPKDYSLISALAIRLGIEVEEKPDHPSVIDDLKDAVNEIKMAEEGKLKLQSARDLINEL